MSYTPLHTHTQYSLLDGAILIPELVQYLGENGMNSCAITDHGNMFGVIEFYKECKKNNIKPIIGTEAYITLDQDGLPNEEKSRDNYHLVLLAKDNIGYRGLLKLVSEAALRNFYYKPRIFFSKLREYRGHLIGTTACLASVLEAGAVFDDEKKKYIDGCGFCDAILSELRECFDPGDIFLELQDWDDGSRRQPAWNEFLLEFGEKNSLPFVITTDAHYLRREDYELHEVMMAMQFRKTLTQYREEGKMIYGPHFWIRPPEVMLESARRLGCEEAYHNTGKIAERCNVEIELGKYYQPTFKVEEASDYDEFIEWKCSRSDRCT
jgi:DNA polymerase-3 subunit alpha